MPAPPPSYEGPHAGLVNEVIACAFSDFILTGSGQAAPPQPLTVITDMRAAVDAAGGVSPRGWIRIDDSAMRRLINLQDLSDYESGLDWHDLQSYLVAEFIWTTEHFDWRRDHKSKLEAVMAMATR